MSTIRGQGPTVPVDVNAGEKTSGKIIFDVPTAEGVIILPELLEPASDNNGWEWAYPAQ
ncbi:hypothetical protein [Kocuria gwangalliensis]|uniref:hypothetical protein n=1 Tax=Kocuria gwangalliensis TaxID=501592 RepID=UPI0031E74DDB